MTTPTKSQSPTVCGWGGLFYSNLTHSYLRVFSISAFLKVIHAPKTPEKKGVNQVSTFKKSEMEKPLEMG